MKIKDLILKLQTFSQDLPVFFEDVEGAKYSVQTVNKFEVSSAIYETINGTDRFINNKVDSILLLKTGEVK